MVFQGSRLFFHSFRWVLLVIQGSRVDFHGSRWVLWFFKVSGWFFIVPGQFLWFFKVPGSFFMVISWFSLFFKVLGCFFRGSRSVLRVNHGSSSVFIFTGRFFMVSGGFSGFLFSRSGFHDSKWIFIIPGWFKSKLSAAGAK